MPGCYQEGARWVGNFSQRLCRIVRVKDWEKAKQFYSQVLGLPVYYSDDAFGWAEYGGTNETRVAIERVDTTELRTEQGGGLAIFTWMTPGR